MIKLLGGIIYSANWHPFAVPIRDAAVLTSAAPICLTIITLGPRSRRP